jgi:hypothetical protein
MKTLSLNSAQITVDRKKRCPRHRKPLAPKLWRGKKRHNRRWIGLMSGRWKNCSQRKYGWNQLISMRRILQILNRKYPKSQRLGRRIFPNQTTQKALWPAQ